MISKKKGTRRQNSKVAVVAWLLLLLAIISTILLREVASETPPPAAGVSPAPATGGGVPRADAEKVKKFVQKYAQGGDSKKGGFEYFQLQQWYWQNSGKSKELRYPRLFPFCARADDVWKANKDDHAYHFHEILEDIELNRGFSQFYHFTKERYGSTSDTNKQNWIEEIKLSRINTPEADMINLRQWMHIKIKTPMEVRGLIVQGIQGPLGMPFGDISLDFMCKDNEDATKDMDIVGQAYPCSRRSRSHLSHPYIYVGYSQKPKKEWHMHFRWTDISCQEMPFFQFLILVVKDFKKNDYPKFGTDYQPLFSPVYENFDFDTPDGAPYPYHPSFKQDGGMTCFKEGAGDTTNEKSAAELKLPESQTLFKIHLDENYDFYSSVRIKKSYDSAVTDLDDAHHLTCPPQTLRCDDEASFNGRKIDELRKRRSGRYLELAIEESNCLPCGPPECLDSGFPEEHCQDVVYDFKAPALDKIDNIAKVKKHGILAMLGFLVFLPLANFVGRFYKEMWGNLLCGNGPWIHIHIAFQILATFFIYISLGPIVYILADRKIAVMECIKEHPDLSKDSGEVQNCIEAANGDLSHAVVGSLAILIHQVLLIFGVFRSSSNKLRLIQVILHSHFGYLAFIFAAVAAILGTHENSCKEVLYFCCVLIILPILFTIAGVILDILTDKKIGVKPGRKQWPVLEPIKLEGRGPFHWPKIIVLIVFMVLMFLVWIIALASAVTLMNLGISDEELAKQPAQNFLESYHPQGILFKCEKELVEKAEHGRPHDHGPDAKE